MKKSTFWVLFTLLQVAILIADIAANKFGLFDFWFDLVSVAACIVLVTIYRKEERKELERKQQMLIHFTHPGALDDPETVKEIARQHAYWRINGGR